MSNVKIQGNVSGTGSLTIAAPNTNTDRVLTLPDASGTLVNTDASGNLGIGTSSPGYNLDIAKNNNKTSIQVDSGNNGIIFTDSGGTRYTIGSSIGVSAPGNYLAFNYYSGSTWSERARINSSGNFDLQNPSVANKGLNLVYDNGGGVSYLYVNHLNVTSGNWYAGFGYNGTAIGSITQSGTSGVAYNTSSDYRLKENIQPMTGALAKVAALKPVTYKWKADGSDGQGFIAHELAEVVPDAVSGEKDAVNEDGSIKPQGIDTSFLVATLTAAIQEQQALITQLQADVAALKGTA